MNPEENKPAVDPGEVSSDSVTPTETLPAVNAETPAVATTPEAPAPEVGGTVIGGNNQATTTVATKPKSKFDLIQRFGKVPVIVAAVVLLSGASAAAYFGVYLPNSPNHIWKSAMTNTSKGLDKIVEYNKQFENMKASKFSGNFDSEVNGVVMDGTFEGESDSKNAKLKADIGAAGSRLNFELLTNTPDGAKSPDIYARVKGVDAFAALLGATSPEYSEFFNSINNQWYVMDHTLFDQMDASGGGAGGVTSLTAKDAYELERAVATVTNQYIFTTAPDKAVLIVRKKVGSEEMNGRKVYHFNVGYNKDNLKEYVNALKDAIKNTNYGKNYPNIDQALDTENMLKDIDEMPDDSNAEVWVDKSTKLVYSVKIVDRDRPSDYLQISLNYLGGNTYPLEIKFYSTEGGTTDLTMNMVTDTDKKNTVLDLTVNFEEGEEKTKISGKMTVEATDQEVQFTKPADAKLFTELIGVLFGGYSGTTDNVLGESSPFLDELDP